MADRSDLPVRPQQPPKSPKRPEDDRMPPYTPGGVPEPAGPVPHSEEERTSPPPTYPPKRAP
ncbi:hypothetical protein [Azospirillum sp. ST 5-10]|uniref:hypothetical protein n=1 Tax=Azospirillum sp. ST 5-10 TaxID=3445776 RepID=UPI003F49D026